MRFKTRHSLTFRLTLLFATASTVVLLALGYLIANSVEKHFEELDMEQLVRDLCAGKKISDIAKRHLVSTCSIYRILQQRPEIKELRITLLEKKEKTERRKVWIKLLHLHGKKGIKAARKTGEKTYIWLYRHDRQWLSQRNMKYQVKAKNIAPRVDWAYRDSILASQATQLVAAIKKNIDRPRISKTFILRKIGYESAIQKTPYKFPRLMGVLEHLVESLIEFQKYRIERAIERLLLSYPIPPLWRIKREATIREWNDALLSHANRYMSLARSKASYFANHISPNNKWREQKYRLPTHLLPINF
jgi:hypothetical protein